MLGFCLLLLSLVPFGRGEDRPPDVLESPSIRPFRFSLPSADRLDGSAGLMKPYLDFVGRVLVARSSCPVVEDLSAPAPFVLFSNSSDPLLQGHERAGASVYGILDVILPSGIGGVVNSHPSLPKTIFDGPTADITASGEVSLAGRTPAEVLPAHAISAVSWHSASRSSGAGLVRCLDQQCAHLPPRKLERWLLARALDSLQPDSSSSSQSSSEDLAGAPLQLSAFALILDEVRSTSPSGTSVIFARPTPASTGVEAGRKRHTHNDFSERERRPAIRLLPPWRQRWLPHKELRFDTSACASALHAQHAAPAVLSPPPLANLRALLAQGGDFSDPPASWVGALRRLGEQQVLSSTTAADNEEDEDDNEAASFVESQSSLSEANSEGSRRDQKMDSSSESSRESSQRGRRGKASSLERHGSTSAAGVLAPAALPMQSQLDSERPRRRRQGPSPHKASRPKPSPLPRVGIENGAGPGGSKAVLLGSNKHVAPPDSEATPGRLRLSRSDLEPAPGPKYDGDPLSSLAKRAGLDKDALLRSAVLSKGLEGAMKVLKPFADDHAALKASLQKAHLRLRRGHNATNDDATSPSLGVDKEAALAAADEKEAEDKEKTAADEAANAADGQEGAAVAATDPNGGQPESSGDPSADLSNLVANMAKAKPLPLPQLPSPVDPMAEVKGLLEAILSIIRPILQGILQPLLNPIMEFVGDAVGEALQATLMGGQPGSMTAMMDQLKEQAMQAAMAAQEAAMAAAQNALESAQAKAQADLEAFSAQAASKAEAAMREAEAAAAKAQNAVEGAAQQAQEHVQQGMDKAQAAAENAQDAAMEAAQQAQDKVEAGVAQAQDAAMGAAQQAQDAVEGAVQQAQDRVQQGVEQAQSAVEGAMAAASEKLQEAGAAVASAVESKVQQAADAVGSAVDQAGKALDSAVSTAADHIASAVDKVADALSVDEDEHEHGGAIIGAVPGEGELPSMGGVKPVKPVDLSAAEEAAREKAELASEQAAWLMSAAAGDSEAVAQMQRTLERMDRAGALSDAQRKLLLASTSQQGGGGDGDDGTRAKGKGLSDVLRRMTDKQARAFMAEARREAASASASGNGKKVGLGPQVARQDSSGILAAAGKAARGKNAEKGGYTGWDAASLLPADAAAVAAAASGLGSSSELLSPSSFLELGAAANSASSAQASSSAAVLETLLAARKPSASTGVGLASPAANSPSLFVSAITQHVLLQRRQRAAYRQRREDMEDEGEGEDDVTLLSFLETGGAIAATKPKGGDGPLLNADSLQGKFIGKPGPGGAGGAVSDAVIKDANTEMAQAVVRNLVPSLGVKGGDSIGASVSAALFRYLSPIVARRVSKRVGEETSDKLSATLKRHLIKVAPRAISYSLLAEQEDDTKGSKGGKGGAKGKKASQRRPQLIGPQSGLPLVPAPPPYKGNDGTNNVLPSSASESHFLSLASHSLANSIVAALSHTLTADPASLYYSAYCYATSSDGKKDKAKKGKKGKVGNLYCEYAERHEGEVARTREVALSYASYYGTYYTAAALDELWYRRERAKAEAQWSQLGDIQRLTPIYTPGEGGSSLQGIDDEGMDARDRLIMG